MWPRGVVDPTRTAEIDVVFVAANDASEVWCISSNYKIFKRPSEIRSPTFVTSPSSPPSSSETPQSVEGGEEGTGSKMPVRNEVWERVKVGSVPARSIAFAGSTVLITDINDMVYKVFPNPLVSQSASSSPSLTNSSEEKGKTSNISFISERINRAILSTVNAESEESDPLLSSSSSSSNAIPVPLPVSTSVSDSQVFASASGSQLQSAKAVITPYLCEKVSDLQVRQIAASATGDLWGLALNERLIHAEYNISSSFQDASFSSFDPKDSSQSIDLEVLIFPLFFFSSLFVCLFVSLSCF